MCKAAILSVCAVLFLSLCGVANAQVNTEPLRKKIKAKGWSLALEASLTGRTGNTDGMDASSGLGLGWSRGPHLAFVYGAEDYAKFDDAVTVANGFAHARYNYEFLPWLWGEAFAQAQSDEFQRLRLRNLFGAGARIAVVQQKLESHNEKTKEEETRKEIDVYVGLSYMFERDVFLYLPDTPIEEFIIAHRANAYVSVNYQLDSRVNFVSTLYVQPRFDDPSDIRVLNETSLIYKMNKRLSASINFMLRYDSVLPPGVLPLDTLLKNTLSMNF
jgi:putative salt-induced outer membrane protein YdiY